MALEKTANHKPDGNEENIADPSSKAFTSQENGDIVKFMCEEVDGGLGYEAAIEYLGQTVYSFDPSKIFKEKSHAVDTAI
ncbi:hypothetical protein NPX13_g5167 [Xylaria arbuscula]|uniref:Uncharacterized protein n=1 Tax=Xylaria arbuscula TaxID=114810 RepID=A0A9W8NF00_9PEZI|nr:hypothetical protein NPX13_g5167 [Xylaria arbuscula]